MVVEKSQKEETPEGKVMGNDERDGPVKRVDMAEVASEKNTDQKGKEKTAEERLVVREERIVLDNKFRFGTDIEEFFLLLESRCSSRNVAATRYLRVLTENCDD
eukprot:Trichotokara_eunicae@DN5424_c0_g1_i1.p2